MRIIYILITIGLAIFLVGFLLWGYHLFFDYDNIELLEKAAIIEVVGASILFIGLILLIVAVL